MRVAFVTMQFPVPSETFASNDARALVEAGVDLSVYTLRFPHPRATQYTEERGLQQVAVSAHSIASFFHGAVFSLQHPVMLLTFLAWVLWANWRKPAHLLRSLIFTPRAWEILKQLQRQQPDIVHLCWGHYPALVGFLVHHLLPDAKLVHSLIAYDLRMNYGGTAAVLRCADRVRTQAQVNAALVAAKYGVAPEKITVIHDSLDIERLERLPERNKIPGRIISVGRLIPAKGMLEVVEVFARVARQHPRATLAILGEGEERAALEARCEELGIASRVSFGGHTPHDETYQAMSEAEVFLFLSKVEVLPNVVKEAMLARCVCIVSDTAGIRELLPDESYGHVVASDALDEASALVAAVLDVPEAYEEMREKAAAFMRERFALKAAVADYLALWRGLLGQLSGSSH